MEKDQQPDSMSAVTIKPEYAPSEVYSSEPPPAYHKSHSSAVQITKIIAATVILCSVILGGFLLASAYVRANASCRALEQELELLSEAADRFQSPVPQPEALIQEEPSQTKRHVDAHAAVPKITKEIETNNIDNEVDQESNSDSSSDSSSEDSSSESGEGDERTPIHIRLPLQLDLDDLAGSILDKNQKSKMNCIVEKKKAEEIVDHQPKMIRLPFGVNVTTNPRFERLSGERMVIVCESGTFQRAEPQPQPQPQENDDQEEDTIMIQPVMIPIPNTPFRTHMPQQMAPPMVQRIVAMVPPPPQDDMRMPMRPPMRPPMHPMETMRPPMPPMMHAPVQMQVQQPNQPAAQQQNEFPPNPVLHHIIQQIIAQKIMESQRDREEQLRQMQMQQQQHRPEEQQSLEAQQPTQESTAEDAEEPRMMQHRFQMQPQVMQRLPIPEEVLTQLNRLPNRNVIVAVQESDSSEEAAPATQEVRFVQEPRQNAVEMNGRQAFAPVNIPVAMMPQPEAQEQEHESQEPQAAESEEARPHLVPLMTTQGSEEPEQSTQQPEADESEEARPHYLHPRSVRSVDNPFKEAKRIKRCACDCAC